LENKTLLYWNSFKKDIEELAFNKVLDLNLLYGLDQQKYIIQKILKISSVVYHIIMPFFGEYEVVEKVV